MVECIRDCIEDADIEAHHPGIAGEENTLLRIEPTDILGKGAGHQFDVLWGIADMPAERVPIPLGLDIFEDMLNYHLM